MGYATQVYQLNVHFLFLLVIILVTYQPSMHLQNSVYTIYTHRDWCSFLSIFLKHEAFHALTFVLPIIYLKLSISHSTLPKHLNKKE